MLLEGKRIFNVEDNPENLAINRILLESAGARFFYERWGMDTVNRIIEVLPIDLIVLDLQFPNEISGYTIFDTLCEHAELANIPVVILTAYDPDERTENAKKNGLKGFLRKPTDARKFIDQIHLVINGGEVWDE